MIALRLDTPEGSRLSAEYDHDGHADGWLLTELTGWIGGVGVRADDVERLGHGSFEGRMTRGARTITVGFLAEAGDRSELWRIEREMSGLFSGGGWGELAVDQDGNELCARVRLDGEVKVTTNLNGGYVNTQVPLLAADPCLYGPWREATLRPVGAGVGLEYTLFSHNRGRGPILTFGSEIARTEPIWNDGNADAYPHFVVTADAPGGFAVSLAGRRVTYPWATFSDMPVLVDMAGAVSVGGVDQSHMLGERAWSKVAPASIEIPSFDLLNGGTGWATVRHRDTYL